MTSISKQLDVILDNQATLDNIVFLIIDKDVSSFYLRGDLPKTVQLPIGVQRISQRYFRHTPPTPDEIEYAINEIEDELEKIVPQIVGHKNLYTSDDFIIHLAKLSKVDERPVMQLSRDCLESTFGQYAEIAMGRPPTSTESDISPLFFAQILLIREIMHHLKFEQINIINLHQ